MSEIVKYHEIISPAKDLLNSVANGISRLLIGNYPPTRVDLDLTQEIRDV